MKNRFTYILSWITFLIYIMSILLLCLMDFSDVPEVRQEWFGIPTDKIVHFIMFFPFPILMTMVFGKSGWKLKTFLLFIISTVITGAMAGGVIELLQAGTGYRSCDISDFIADSLGTATGAVLTVIAWKLCKKSKE